MQNAGFFLLTDIDGKPQRDPVIIIDVQYPVSINRKGQSHGCKNVGFLHPGLMGVSLAASVRNTGHTVHWVSQGRSGETRERAVKQNLVELQTYRRICFIIISGGGGTE